MAFELEIAGTIFPAISLILKKLSIGMLKLFDLMLAAAVTNSTALMSSLSKEREPTSYARSE
jgi:hypothetical protein